MRKLGQLVTNGNERLVNQPHGFGVGKGITPKYLKEVVLIKK